MDILYLLVPLSLVLVAVIVWAFLWAVRSGQLDDLEGPGHAVLMDNDAPAARRNDTKAHVTEGNARHDREPPPP